jgi:competence protein ComEC
VWTALGATVGAQVAVAPILLVVFGSIPLVAPIANLAAAPVVAVTTVVGMVVIIAPLPLLTSIAGIGATVILDIARRTSEGPQLGVIASVAMGVVVLAIISRWTRPLGLAALCCVALFVAAGQPSWPTSPTAVVLDVGQGDAILLQDPSGLAMLVDGGREPAVLDRALRRHGVRSLAVVVVTHADADHVGGLVEVVEGLDVGEVWIGADATTAALLDDVLDAAARRDIPVVEVGDGLRGALGDIALEVVGPRRRYLGDNDGSVVILAAARRSILLAGDIEAVAQRELAPVAPDVLLVPHHGSATSDLEWLERTLDEVAILSYGPNTYGHPDPAVVDVLEHSGAEIHRTATDGDITIELG